MCKFLVLFILTFLYTTCCCQKVAVEEIVFLGNNKTTQKAILQELDFSRGDSLKLVTLPEVFLKNKNQLLSTGLFNSVDLNLKNYNPDTQSGDIHLKFEENWYVYPVPIFELADRNFNVWWTEQNRSLSRLNYGVRLAHYNFTGNRDPLKIKLQLGFTRKFEIRYAIPYLSKDHKWGLAATVFYADNKTIGYKTINNKTLWHQNEEEDVLLRRIRLGPEIKYRPTVNQYHAFRIEYHHNKIDSYVIENLTTDYFLNGATDLRMMFLEYDYQFDKRQYTLYPDKGYALFLNIKKEGLGVFGDVNNFNIAIAAEYFLPLKESLVFGTRIRAKTNLNRNRIAFANNTGLGWDQDVVSGYELYVMDGSDFFITKNKIRVQLFEKNMKTTELVPKQFRKVNIGFYLRFNFDVAFVNEQYYTDTNELNNRLIYGYGPAFDMILFNNFLFSFEYSINDIGEKGLYFHNKISF